MCRTSSATTEVFLNRALELVRLEPGRSLLALEGDATVPADQVQAVRPSAVLACRLVVESVDQHGHADLQPHRTRLGDRGTLAGGRRVGDRDLLLPVRGEHPAVL